MSSGIMQHFLYPISPARRRKAIHALAAGECISVGSCNILPEDSSGILWGTDITGDDVCLSNENNLNSAARAVDWAIAMQHNNPPQRALAA